ncbi:MAG TPA: N-acetylmuramoyl-L-alanine amidase, partial [Candidatus Bathyarchaeia archaeon]|nr:N-acetylmuramoyl-L-alanine amidase [Candidatus Bathyarchaeia archaeon]
MTRSSRASALGLALVLAIAPWGSSLQAAPISPIAATPARETSAAGVSAATASTSIVAAALPLSGLIIAIDPGHNGGNAAHPAAMNRLVFIGNGYIKCTSVGTSTRSGFPEHRMVFAVASRLKLLLTSLGATVYMTRTTDTGFGPCADYRGRFGTRLHAALTVSIHGDGAVSSARGFFVMRPGLVRGYTDDIYTSSYRLAIHVRDGLKSVGLPIANYYATNGLKTRTDFGSFNLSDIPVVMVELGNMKNSTDAARMTTWAGRDRYARGLLAGIRTYL